MQALYSLAMNEEKKIKEQLNILQDMHRELDMKIMNGALNMLELQRLKKQKLMLKDQMSSLQSSLYSDIIA
jgi:hypothetical protein